MASKKDKIFIAEVTKEGKIVNIAPLLIKYQPTTAQQEYFIGNFIKLVRNLSLDPITAKNNWLSAYNFLTPRSAKILNEHFHNNNPTKSLGKHTITTTIHEIKQLSKNTFQAYWTETLVNINGKSEKKKQYSGTFTVKIKQPKTKKEILQNPLGLYLVDFHLSLQEH